MTRIWTYWPFVAALASAVILAVVHGLETFGHLAPCELCIKEREVYWAAIAVGLAGGALGVVAPRWTGWVSLLLALIFLGGAGLAAYHAGVEWKFWPGPQSCTGGGAKVSIADLQRLLNGGSMGVPQCDKPAWVFLGLSLAGWDALASLSLGGKSLYAAWRRLRPAVARP